MLKEGWQSEVAVSTSFNGSISSDKNEQHCSSPDAKPSLTRPRYCNCRYLISPGRFILENSDYSAV